MKRKAPSRDSADKRHITPSDSGDESYSVSKKVKKDVSQSKRPKRAPKEESSNVSTPESQKYIDLGRKKRVSVSVFKDIPLLDIREYYTVDGEERPGKKGISLTRDQWNVLKENLSAIDDLFSSQKKD